MADWAFRTLITTAATTPLARDIAATLSPTAGQNMWLTGLSATGNAPATHYVSTGLISPEFAALVPEQMWEQDENGDWVQTGSTPGDPVACYDLCVASGMTVTQAQVNAVYAASDVTQQEPFVAFSRLGLLMVQEPL
jgi:hypothetical protein